ncbi:RSC complex subunit [Drechmeria coniospora]|uniref:RSC complex subunit n=1 Tax=Drechmeria coniospora TaxID=98403 RepID=A0A151GRN2_DRECN|nr:RSC complex subunit [Drechmeria coniospora]KYK59711.1 RSC complex subunit [Drechmeria coniospora]ODA78519.1 hypothetical protein RJ55_05900 [Drechmeria coniospora]
MEEDSAAHGSPGSGSGTSPDGNPVLESPPLLQPPHGAAAGGQDVHMSEAKATESSDVPEDSPPSVPVVASHDGTPSAPEGPATDSMTRADQEMGDAPPAPAPTSPEESAAPAHASSASTRENGGDADAHSGHEDMATGHEASATGQAAAAGTTTDHAAAGAVLGAGSPAQAETGITDMATDTTTGAIAGPDVKSKQAMESAARAHLAAQTHAIVLPSYSTWFDMNAIHTIERKALAEFFSNRNRSKTAAVYKDYRDFMINTYRLNPSEYLTVTAARRNLAGDVCSIMRVHAFLEQWGLINYQVDADQRPSHVGPPFTGHFKIICDTPRGLQAWQPSADPVVLEGKKHVDTDRKASTPTAAKADMNLEIGRNVYEANAKMTAVAKTETNANDEAPMTNGVSSAGEPAGAPLSPVFCCQCGNDCTRVYFHFSQMDPMAKSKQTDLCPVCFTGGRIPANHTTSMYTKMENKNYTKGVGLGLPWTDAELLRLLEGLERFDEDWGEIADHVGTRTREECVLQFLQLDIEEKYLDSETAVNPPTGMSYLGAQRGTLPFNVVDNPVLSIVGFLASLADPETTATAARTSADELKRSLRKQLNGATDEGKAGGNDGEEPAPAADSMEVDAREEPAPATKTETKKKSKAEVASIPLASTGARAAAFASHEEREMTRLVSAACNVMLQKLELKLKYFNEMESVLRSERRELERGRQQLLLDRLAFRRRVRDAEESLAAATAGTGGQGRRDTSTVASAGEAEKFKVQFATAAAASMKPPSSEGPTKTHEV